MYVEWERFLRLVLVLENACFLVLAKAGVIELDLLLTEKVYCECYLESMALLIWGIDT